jgi:glycosyltransferase involved in cell wall biosynthesis
MLEAEEVSLGDQNSLVKAKPRIAVINSLCVERDAISESVRGTVEALSGVAEVRLFSYRCDYRDIDSVTVQSTRELLLHPFYNNADILFYHYGVFYDLFNTVLIGNGLAERIVYFHNITPKNVLPPSEHTLTDKSLRQRANIQAADRVLVNSEFTQSDLLELGIDPHRLEVCPLYTRFSDLPPRRRHSNKRRHVELLYVGRFVMSKGVTDLIRAAAEMRKAGLDFYLRLAGNLAFSDPAYVTRVKDMIDANGLSDCVTLEGEVSDRALLSLYERADVFVMPSYHEGFCVPILEAYQAGCIPVAYDAGNLPSVVGESGVLVQTGDQHGLARALASLVRQLSNGLPAQIDFGRGQPILREEYETQVAAHLARHSFARFAVTVRTACGFPPNSVSAC